MNRRNLLRGLAAGQGVFYVATGIWPLLSMRSFERVTGPKVDDWLVKTVGLMIAVTGAALSLGGLRDRVGTELLVLGAGGAAALAAVDVVYVRKGTISPIYLADAAVEVPLAAAWLALYERRADSGRR
jgi:hypothetical protein